MGVAGFVFLVASGLLVTIGMGAMMVFLLLAVTWDAGARSYETAGGEGARPSP